MPWTEYFWHFDRFLRGGQDLEFGLLSLVTVLCLVLLLSKLGKERFDFAFSALRELSSAVIDLRKSQSENLCRWTLMKHVACVPAPVLERYNLPIRI